jgi:hypothetical protein
VDLCLQYCLSFCLVCIVLPVFNAKKESCVLGAVMSDAVEICRLSSFLVKSCDLPYRAHKPSCSVFVIRQKLE